MSILGGAWPPLLLWELSERRTDHNSLGSSSIHKFFSTAVKWALLISPHPVVKCRTRRTCHRLSYRNRARRESCSCIRSVLDGGGGGGGWGTSLSAWKLWQISKKVAWWRRHIGPEYEMNHLCKFLTGEATGFGYTSLFQWCPLRQGCIRCI